MRISDWSSDVCSSDLAGHFTASDARFAKKHRELAEQLVHVKTDIVMLERQLANSERRITPELIERFAQLMREKLRSDDPALRRFYVKAIVGRVEVGDHQIRISGSSKELEHAVDRKSTRLNSSH